VRQMLVCFWREVRSAFHLKTVKGRVHILHSRRMLVSFGSNWEVRARRTSSMVFFEHLDVGVLGETVFANRGEICGLPSRSIKILFNLRRGHCLMRGGFVRGLLYLHNSGKFKSYAIGISLD